jgi:nucleoside-diphosphate-sugar epimerase
MSVRVLARTPSKARSLAELGAEIISGDITRAETLVEAVAGCQYIFHAAAAVSESTERRLMWVVNVGGTQNVIDAAVAAGTVKRFVHVSSCSVYGSLQKLNISEETPIQMRGDPYADSKVEAERLLWQAYERCRLPVVAARASQVYGPRSYQFTIRPVEVILAGKMILVDGGRYLCKPIYVDNLVDGLILCATVDGVLGEAINLTDDEAIPWRDFFGAYGQMLGINSFPSVPFPVAWLVALLNEVKAGLQGKQAKVTRKAIMALRSYNSFSNQKAKTLMGWTPRVDFGEGMRLTERWLRAEGYFNN